MRYEPVVRASLKCLRGFEEATGDRKELGPPESCIPSCCAANSNKQVLSSGTNLL
jgi:hypothetical protein